MRKPIYFILLIFGIILFSVSYVASGIVGSYIIKEENMEEHLIFTDTPASNSDVSDIDKFLYSFEVSIYPYVAIFSLVFIIIITLVFLKRKR
ncbi:DUF4306 domain-containing protein [Virgibacillus sp. L01]|uniref:DUF4306 domain-containing protein n=1 Tax=Virgibacillus sp. L01 TaxID=3457429 RepID=UPI003FD6A0D5